MKTFTYLTYKSTFKSIPDIIQHMAELQEELKNSDMENLIPFNTAYFIITKNVFARIGTGYFEHDKLMQQFDIHFAKYYFNALKNYVENKPAAPAWKTLFELCKQDSVYQSVYMALGINAHVNNDLAFSLYEVLKNNDFAADYYKVNHIIHNSLFEVIAAVTEKLPRIEKTKNKLKLPYSLYMDIIIKKWRNNAWNNYKYLKNNKKNKQTIEQNAQKIALELMQITSFRRIDKILRIL